MLRAKQMSKYFQPDKPWATTGKTPDRDRNIITTLYIESENMEQKNFKLQKKFKEISENEVRYEAYKTDQAEIIIVAYGLCSRVSKKVVDLAAEAGMKLGLIRPITLWPFPSQYLEGIASQNKVKAFVSVEMSSGQMIEDVKLAVNGRKPVYFYGRTGGIIPTPDEIFNYIREQFK